MICRKHLQPICRTEMYRKNVSYSDRTEAGTFSMYFFVYSTIGFSFLAFFRSSKEDLLRLLSTKMIENIQIVHICAHFSLFNSLSALPALTIVLKKIAFLLYF